MCAGKALCANNLLDLLKEEVGDASGWDRAVWGADTTLLIREFVAGSKGRQFPPSAALFASCCLSLLLFFYFVISGLSGDKDLKS